MSKLKLTIILSVLFSLTSCGTASKVIEDNNTGTDTISSDDTNTSTETTKSDEISSNKQTFTGNYVSPAWEEKISFDVEYNNNWEITELKATSYSENRITLGYVQKFNEWVENSIIGKKVSEVEWVVNWASLATGAFKKIVSI